MGDNQREPRLVSCLRHRKRFPSPPAPLPKVEGRRAEFGSPPSTSAPTLYLRETEHSSRISRQFEVFEGCGPVPQTLQAAANRDGSWGAAG